uniref:Uncharacterized protein isoform X2 n=1 Tax=Nicotiana tabacum TaxID=4097 RepID=A0A1S4AKQ1_TOBAC|nr:PREDICTED: uncharacterized protein LOC107798757 isoform X2 [Nicotiana tabacum]
MRSTSPSTQTIHEEVQQLPPHSTSLASQAVRENLQQLPLDSTTRTSQTIQEQFEDSINHETNEQLEEQGPSSEKKRKRGKTQMSGVHGRKERKQVVLNETNQPIGHTDEVVKELGSFLGTLARNATFCPLNVFNWRKLETKEDMWKYVKEKYDIPEVAEVWGFKSIQNAWRKYKNKLMKEYFEAYENDELRMEKRPIDVPESQFRELINIGTLIPTRNCPKPKTNMKNHRKLRYPHTAGITSFALIREKKKKRSKLPKLYQVRTSLWLQEKENLIEYLRPRMRIHLIKLYEVSNLKFVDII